MRTVFILCVLAAFTFSSFYFISTTSNLKDGTTEQKYKKNYFAKEKQRGNVEVIVIDKNFNAGEHGELIKNVIKKVFLGAKIKEEEVSGVDENIYRLSYYAALKKVNNYIVAHPHTTFVINLSMGGSYYDKKELELINKLLENDVIIVASAGNDGEHEYCYPASYKKIISVATVTKTNKKSQYSNYNRDVDICAYGLINFSTINSHGFTSGTSFSSPYVAAVIAKMLDKNHYLKTMYAINIIKETAKPINDIYYQKGFLGAGSIDKNKALGIINQDFSHYSTKEKIYIFFKWLIVIIGFLAISYFLFLLGLSARNLES